MPRRQSQDKGYPLPQQRRDDKGYPLPQQQPPEQKGYPLPAAPQQEKGYPIPGGHQSTTQDPYTNFNYQSPQDFYNSEDYPPVQPFMQTSNSDYPQPPPASNANPWQTSGYGANAPAANYLQPDYGTGDDIDYYEYSRLPASEDEYGQDGLEAPAANQGTLLCGHHTLCLLLCV